MIFIVLFNLLTTLALAVPAPLAERDTPVAGRGLHQPYQHGYNASNLKSWTPDSDPYAKYLRSRVPLASRIAPLAATQANPNLATGPQLIDLSPDYDNSFFTSYKYNDDYTRRVSRFWQYTDIYGSWHGQPIWNSPTDNPVHGVINLPNPAWTDAAHRNGAKSIACWFWPRTGVFSDYVTQDPDGSFPVADKMIEMAAYYGFDGYFINQEAPISSTDASALMKMMQYIRKKAPEGFHVQMYDADLPSGQLQYQNQLNNRNSPWLLNNGVPGVNSMFINYWLTREAQVQTSADTAKGLGLDPYQVVYTGTNTEQYGFNPPYDTRLIMPEGKPAITSWALFGTHFPWSMVPNPGTVGSVPQSQKIERQLWSGPNEDPTKTGRTTYTPWPYNDNGVPRSPLDATKWDGVAHYITERSVVGSFPFVTRFNTGSGLGFFLGGESASTSQWNNQGLVDILPTWQWWARSEKNGTPLTVDYDYTTAYDGGSSLVVSGNLAAGDATVLRLFKTSLAVTGSEAATVTFSPPTGGGTVELGFLFADDTNAFTWLPLKVTGNGSGKQPWQTGSADLSAYQGKTIVTIALRFSSAAGGQFKTNIGEIALLPKASSKPSKPATFNVDAVYPSGSTAEVFLSWTLDPSVWYYDITRQGKAGATEVVGRILDEVYYIKSLAKGSDNKQTMLRLEAVGKDGSRSPAATATVNWS